MIKSIIPSLLIIAISVVLLLAIPGYVLDILISLNLVFILFILLNILYSKNIQGITLVPMMLHLSIIINIVITIASARIILNKKDEIDSKLIGNIYKIFSCSEFSEVLISFLVFLSVLLFFLLFITPKLIKIIEVSSRLSQAKAIANKSNSDIILTIFTLTNGIIINNVVCIISFFLTITCGIGIYYFLEKQLLIDSFMLFVSLGYGLGFFYLFNSILLYTCVYFSVTKYCSDDDIHYMEIIRIEAGFELYEIIKNNDKLINELITLNEKYRKKLNIHFNLIHLAENRMNPLDSYEFSIIICAKETIRKKIKKNSKDISKIIYYADKYIKRNLHEILKWEKIKTG